MEELKTELERIKAYLAKLEEERRKGTISEKAYEKLRKEYLTNINRLKNEVKTLEKETSVIFLQAMEHSRSVVRKEFYEGFCEECGMWSGSLSIVKGRLLCEDCAAKHY